MPCQRFLVVLRFAQTTRAMRFAVVAKTTNVVRTGIISLMSLAAAALCVPPQARAATVIATVTGKLTYGYDGFEGYPASTVFGFKPGTDMTGYSYTAVYTFDDQRGIPYGERNCMYNGLKNFGLNTPVTSAVLTINGKSFTLNPSNVTSINSFVDAGQATNPKMFLDFWLEDYFNGAGGAQGHVELEDEIELDTKNVCRYWQAAFNYKLKSTWELSNSGGQFLINIPYAGGYPYAQQAVGYLSEETVTVSGPITAPHILYVNSTRGVIDLTQSGQMPTVAVGQKISLIVVPSVDGGGVTPWDVPGGNPIGGYTAVPCHGASCNNYKSYVDQADFGNPAGINFYWTVPSAPGTPYTVTYNYGAGQPVTATFMVVGPTNVSMNPVAGQIGLDNDPKYGQMLRCGGV